MKPDEDGGMAYNVQVIPRCELSADKGEALSSLLREVLALTLLPDEAVHLAAIIVAPDKDVAPTVSTILSSVAHSELSYAPGPYAPSATAVPVERDGFLACFVVLSESLVQAIDPMHYHAPDTVSAILEELLHVRLYARTWKRRGHLFPKPGQPACDADLFALCSMMHDEYVVMRWKSSIASTVALFEIDGSLTGGTFRYGAPIAPLLDGAADELDHIVRDATMGRVAIQESWGKAVNRVYRKVFEPLARDAAVRDEMPEIGRTPEDALGSWFYREHIAAYWRQIHEQLDRAFRSDLVETEAALRRMGELVKEFLNRIGVSFRTTDSGHSWVDFSTRFFDAPHSGFGR